MLANTPEKCKQNKIMLLVTIKRDKFSRTSNDAFRFRFGSGCTGYTYTSSTAPPCGSGHVHPKRARVQATGFRAQSRAGTCSAHLQSEREENGTEAKVRLYLHVLKRTAPAPSFLSSTAFFFFVVVFFFSLPPLVC